MDSLYLDHNASTPLRREAFEAMRPWLEQRQANASSLHKAGQAARAAIESVRASVAKALGAQPEEIFFTSGATEACNLALLATVERPAGPLRLSQAEHPAVLQTAAALAAKGCDVKALPVTAQASVDLPHLRAAMQAAPGAVLACMHANNETGSLNPVDECARLAHPGGGLFFCDITQSLGKMPLDLHALDIDLAAASAHKFGGPQGVGILFKRRSLRLAAASLWRRPGAGPAPGHRGSAGHRGDGGGPGGQPFRPGVASPGLVRGARAPGLGPETALAPGPDPRRRGRAGQHAFRQLSGAGKGHAFNEIGPNGPAGFGGLGLRGGGLPASHVLEAMGVGPAAMSSVVRFSFGAGQGPQEAARMR